MNNNKGQSVFEVVIALGLITLVLLSVVAIAGLSIKNTIFSRNNTFATRISEEALEWLNKKKNENWDTFKAKDYANPTVSTWCFTTLSWDKNNVCDEEDYISETTLKREILLDSIDEDNIEVKVKVYWTDSGGYHEVSSDTIFSNWKN